MLFLKNALGMKLVLGALGVLLGVGGIAAGATYHAAHHANQTQRRLILGRIERRDGLTLVITTRSGQTVTVHLTPRTIIRHRGRPAPAAQLQPGVNVLVQLTRTSKGELVAVHISIIKLAPSALGP